MNLNKIADNILNFKIKNLNILQLLIILTIIAAAIRLFIDKVLT